MEKWENLLKEQKKDIDELRNELDEVANAVPAIGSATLCLAVEGQDIEVGG